MKQRMLTIFVLAIFVLAVGVLLTGCGGKWAAKVNGEKIMESEVESQLAELEKDSKRIFSGPDGEGRKLDYRDQILNVLIDQAIVRQRAKKEGVKASSSEVDKEVERLKDLIPDGDWSSTVEGAGYTEETMRKQIESQIITAKLVEKYGDSSSGSIEDTYLEMIKKWRDEAKIEIGTVPGF